MRQLIAFVSAVILIMCCSAFPQSSQATAKIGALHFKGLQHFTETQVLAAIDLHPGAMFDKDRIDAVTQRLAQSGAFQEVSYTYRSAAGAINVEFVVKEATKFHRCVFDNFVWLQDSDLQSLLREKVPLYEGTAPEAGELLEEIAAALQNAATSQHISGTVNHIQYGRLGDPQWEHLFSMTGPVIKITGLRFNGTQGIEESALIQVGKSLIGRDYSMVECRAYGRAMFPDYYRERGFLNVEVDEPSVHVAKHSEGSGAFDIQVSYPVKEGLRYQFDGAQWEANMVYPGQKLDGFLGMKPGEIANAKKLEAGWDTIKKEYGRQGYIEAQLKHEPIFDDANRKVRFQVPVIEGPQYRMGTFVVSGLPGELASSLQSKWRLKTGEVYDASYMPEYFRKELGSVLAKYGNNPPKISPKQVLNRAQNTVDITLQFASSQ